MIIDGRVLVNGLIMSDLGVKVLAFLVRLLALVHTLSS
jgi:hypothetical protein